MTFLVTRTSIPVFNLIIQTQSIPVTNILCRYYASDIAKKPASFTASTKKKNFEVETDTHRLVNYACGTNIYKVGEDVKIKPESEYPDWLWTIYTGPEIKLHELDPNNKHYWLKARALARRKMNRVHRLKIKILKHMWG